MIQTEFKEALFKFIREACVKEIASIFLFGSVAKGTADNRSDIDLLVVFDTENKDIEGLEAKTRISEIALSIEREYERNLQIVFSNKRFSGLDDYFVEKVLSEGILLYSKSPRVSVNGLQLEAHVLLLYQVEGLDRKDRMKIKRVLFGYRSRKEVKGRVYRTEKEGLVSRLGGRHINPGAIVLPKKNVQDVEEKLKGFKVEYKIVDIWLSEDSVVKFYV